MAALVAQQYYVEVGDKMSPERLTRMIPAVIPDSLLAGPSAQDKWTQMIVASFNRVSAAVGSRSIVIIVAAIVCPSVCPSSVCLLFVVCLSVCLYL